MKHPRPSNDNIRNAKPPQRFVFDIYRAAARAEIAREFYTLLKRLGADPGLLAVVGSWRDTLDDAGILALLREYNRTGKVLQQPH
jgi:hypothetical protein